MQRGAPTSIEEVRVGSAACGLEESRDDRLLNTFGLEGKEACYVGPDGGWGGWSQEFCELKLQIRQALIS